MGVLLWQLPQPLSRGDLPCCDLPYCDEASQPAAPAAAQCLFVV